jgi:hypothetical protein
MLDSHDITRRARGLHIITPVLLVSFALLTACTGTRERTETVVTTQPTVTQATPAQGAPSAQPAATATASPSATPASAPAPSPNEVTDKVTRIFQGAAQVDQAQQGKALVGDFNGDGSEDIAVVVKPDPARLEDFNSEVSLWILNDPHKVVLPDPKKATQHLPAPEPIQVEAGDVLLAVIHGFKEEGWRNPAAQQTYVLKNAIGSDLRVEPRHHVMAEYKLSMQQVRGDCIRADTGREAGLIYWMGAKYAWLPTKEK